MIMIAQPSAPLNRIPNNRYTQNNLIDEVSGMLDGKLMYMSRPEKVKRLNSVKEKMDELCFEVLS